jgi:hypothetical protein
MVEKYHDLPPMIEPECDPETVRSGILEELSEPYLVACACPLQVSAFIAQHGLHHWQVRSVSSAGSLLGRVREDKLILLLPGWECCRRTARLVTWWRATGRNAVEMPDPTHGDFEATENCRAWLGWILLIFLLGLVIGLAGAVLAVR